MHPSTSTLTHPYYFISSPPSSFPSPLSKKVAIVILHDIFGLQIPNAKLIADQLCTQLTTPDGPQVDVYVPDYLSGWEVPESALQPVLNDVPNQKSDQGIIAKILGFLPLLRYIPYMIALRPGATVPKLEVFLQSVRKEGPYEKVGTVGFCLGGTQQVALLGLPSATAIPPIMDAAVICHPGPTSLKDIGNIEIPTAWVCSEEDQSFNDQKQAETEAILREKKDQKGLDYEMRLFKGTCHGFAARPNLEIDVVREAFVASGEMIRDWFKKYIVDAA